MDENTDYFAPIDGSIQESREGLLAHGLYESDEPFSTRQPQTCGSKTKACLNRNKKKLTIATVVLVVVAVSIPLIMVIAAFGVAPVFVRNLVTKAQLVVTQLDLQQPGSDSVMLSLNAYLTTTSPVPARLLATTMTLQYKGATIGHVAQPEVLLGPGSPASPVSGTTALNFASALNISSLLTFNAFANDLINQKSVVWSLSGSTSVVIPLLFGVNIPVTIEKSVTLVGLDGLKSLKLYDMAFGHSPGPVCTNVTLDASVALFNPSSVSMSPIGNLTLDVYYQGTKMGVALSPNVSIYAGNNSFAATVYLQPRDLNKASTLISDFLAARTINAQVIAPAHNATSVPLYANALANLTIDTSFAQPSPTVLIPKIDVSDMSLYPIDNATAAMSVKLRATIANPLGLNCPLYVYTTAIKTSINYMSHVTGRLDAPASGTIILAQNATSLSLYSPALFHIDRSSIQEPGKTWFAAMIQDIETSKTITMEFVGETNITAFITTIGNVSLSRLPLALSIPIPGLQSLPGSLIGDLYVPSNYPNASSTTGKGLLVTAVAHMHNPAPISMFVGDVSFDMFFGTTKLGHITSRNVQISPGDNLLNATGYLLPTNMTVAANFFHNYLFGVNSIVDVVGNVPGVTTVPPKDALVIRSISDTSALASAAITFNIDWVYQAIESLRLKAILPSIQVDLVPAVTIQSLRIDFTQPNGIPVANGIITATYALPPNLAFPVTFVGVSLNSVLSYGASSNMVQLIVPNEPITQNNPGAKQFNIPLVDIQLVVLDVHGFKTFVKDLMLSPSATTGLVGTATSVDLQTNMGLLPMRNVPLNNALVFPGLNWLLNDIVIPAGSVVLQRAVNGTMLEINLMLRITNPSIALTLGDFSLDIYFNGQYVGNATVPDLTLATGVGNYPCKVYYLQTPTNSGRGLNGNDFLSTFVDTTDAFINLYGSQRSTGVYFLKEALESLVTNTTVPGQPGMMTYIKLNNANILPWVWTIQASISLTNPFPVTFSLHNPSIKVYTGTTHLATLDQFCDNDSCPPTFAPGASVTRLYTAKLAAGITLSELKVILGLEIKVRLEGWVTMEIQVPGGGSFTQDILFKQSDVKAGCASFLCGII